jgi:hypothetical protein
MKKIESPLLNSKSNIIPITPQKNVKIELISVILSKKECEK